MSTPSLNDIKTSTEKAVGFIEWLAEVLRGKNWVTKLLLLDVIVFAVFNPLFFPTILKLFISEPELPGHYRLFFWFVIGIIFIIALIIALRTKPHKAKAPAIDLSTRSAIKGLRPFGFEDAEIFAQLQREQSIRECFESITAPNFRFGVLCGESGCGKTSFLQAGLIPQLKQQYQCVYVKFTDLDPLESIRQALIEEIQIPEARAETADFLSLLETAVKENSKTLVLFFDQFEQFFVHHKLKEQREPFVQALAAWYKDKPRLRVKIFVCMRGDFSDRLIELQKAMGYSLGPQDSIRLEKLTPDEAAEIFHVIAETEGIACDADFVKELAKQELAREDGMISPVDIQILAWMIWGQKTADERAFNKHAFQQLGGIEGLLERFLSRVLWVRQTEERRQTAIKVLLALTDLERNVRAGVLTVENLQKKLAGSVADSELTETVQWLARSDVRLITPGKLGKNFGYELAHERLIPALRKIANKELTEADQANQLLNRRANEWLANDRDNHYLLRWQELHLINKQKNFLVWGELEKTKKELIAQSQRRQKKQVFLILCLILCSLLPIFINKIIRSLQREQRIQRLGLEFVFIPGGTFEMGDSLGQRDEKPMHKVKLSNFKMSKYEITNQQYCKFLNSINKSGLNVDAWLDTSHQLCKIKENNGKFEVDAGYELYPIVTVTWNGADNFVKWLRVHLPTEAQWEYAARAGGQEIKYPWGKDPPDSSRANYWIEGKTNEPKPVGSYRANDSGLYDMAGNVWEWCNDWYNDKYYEICHQQGTVKNPEGPSSSPYGCRVLRGGSWYRNEVSMRCSNRSYDVPNYSYVKFGFRVVR